MPEDESSVKKIPTEVKIYYEKSKQHRTINISGAWVGVTPTLGVQLALYNDLRPMPELTTNAVTKEGKLGSEIETLEKKGIVRETEVTVVMAPQVAAELLRLIQQMLNQIPGYIPDAAQNPTQE